MIIIIAFGSLNKCMHVVFLHLESLVASQSHCLIAQQHSATVQAIKHMSEWKFDELCVLETHTDSHTHFSILYETSYVVFEAKTRAAERRSETRNRKKRKGRTMKTRVMMELIIHIISVPENTTYQFSRIIIFIALIHQTSHICFVKCFYCFCLFSSSHHLLSSPLLSALISYLFSVLIYIALLLSSFIICLVLSVSVTTTTSFLFFTSASFPVSSTWT